MNETAAPAFNFKRFFLRSLLGNYVIAILLGIVLMLMWNKVVSLTANRSWFFIGLVTAVISTVHTLLLIVFTIRRAGRKEWKASLLLLINVFIGMGLTYWLFMVWVMSIAFAAIR